MRKKFVKLIESVIPNLYDHAGDLISKRNLANKILDSIPNAEKLDIEPFETFVPLACSGCYYNGGRDKGCMYDLFTEDTHDTHKPPRKCPFGHTK